MFDGNPLTAESALLYFVDCQLATVCDLAMKKSRKAGDYRRQKAIAQKMCDTIVELKIKINDGNRINSVLKDGSVEAWATVYEQRWGTTKET